MHHFKAKGGTVFNFNSDLSGDVLALPASDSSPLPSDVDGNAVISGADLLEFVDWYRSTPGYGAPDREDAREALTPEEREFLGRLSELAKLQHFEARVLQKVLRIHDQQAVEIDNLRFRLSMAESSNPDSVLSKHNAMLMAVAGRDRLAAENARLREANHASKDLRQACQDEKQRLYGEIDKLEKRVSQLESNQAFKGPLG